MFTGNWRCLWLLLVAGMIALLSCLLFLGYVQAQRQAEANTRNLNLIFEERLNATLQGSQAILQSMALRGDDRLFTLPADSPIGRRHLKALSYRFIDIGNADLLTTDGRLLLSSSKTSEDATANELSFWASLRQQPKVASNLSSMVVGDDGSRAVAVFDTQHCHLGCVAFRRPLKTLRDLFEHVSEA